MERTNVTRRDILKIAAATGAAMATTPLFAQSTPSVATPPAPPTSAASVTTPQGLALVQAAYAAAGFPLPSDQAAEVHKQLEGYPGDFAKARKFELANGDAPDMNVSPAIR